MKGGMLGNKQIIHRHGCDKTNYFIIILRRVFNMKTTTIKKVNRFKLNAIKATLAVTTAMMFMANSAMLTFAANEENGDPTGLGGGTTMGNMVGLVFWAVRVLVLLVGGVPGVMKVVQGQADENTKDRNQGLATLGITGAAFAASFVVESLI